MSTWSFASRPQVPNCWQFSTLLFSDLAFPGRPCWGVMHLPPSFSLGGDSSRSSIGWRSGKAKRLTSADAGLYVKPFGCQFDSENCATTRRDWIFLNRNAWYEYSTIYYYILLKSYIHTYIYIYICILNIKKIRYICITQFYIPITTVDGIHPAPPTGWLKHVETL